jgi:hypothetical protein
MKKTIIIGIFTLLLTGHLFCQVQEKDIYEVLNQLIKINNVEILSKKAKALSIEDPYKDEFIIWCINDGEDRIKLSQIDSSLMMKQIHSYVEIKWDKRRINKNIKIKKKSVNHFTIPLFLNEDKNLFIVYHRQYAGPMAAQGTYELYKKVNNEWKLINVQLVFVS